jgi:dGTPase
MSWDLLLDQTRIRQLREGKPSLKAEAEARSEFERDRDRTIYSSPIRRLIGKTQVFPLDPNDHVRTRLVHSLEVSTVAEGLASQVVREVITKREPQLSEHQHRAISKIAETTGLLHDVGNPPFGHAGELAISSWFEGKRKPDLSFFAALGGPDSQKAQDFLRFEGNAQTMRIATNSHLLGHDYGLNLTCATTAAARKYIATSLSADRKGPNHAYAKPGYFFSESEIFQLVSERTGTEGRRHPITFLVEAADDIVYSVVDIEDSVKKGILTWETVREFLANRCKDSELFFRAIQRATKQLESGYQSDSAYAQAFRVNAISELVLAAVRLFGDRYDDIMGGQYKGELTRDADYEGLALVSACKALLGERVFRQDEVLRLEVLGRRVIHDLMDLFWEGVSLRLTTPEVKTDTYAGKLYLLIADSYRFIFEKRLNATPEDGTYLGLQLLTDYISGMTDGFASRLHEGLVNG